MVGRRGAYHGVRHGNDDFLLGGGSYKSLFAGRGYTIVTIGRCK